MSGKEKREVEMPGGILPNGCLFEQVQIDGVSKFAVKGSELGIHTTAFIENENEIFVPLTRSPWPLPSEPLNYESEEQLWKEVRQFIKDHVDYPDDRFYDVLTAWVLATWRVEEWKAVAYLIFLGPIDSGKTRALETLAAVSFRGYLATSITEATLFRIVDKYKPTIFIDQTETLTDESKRAVISLLNSGYRRGQLIPRVRDQDREIEFFECFGFKALAGIRELNESIRSRAFNFKMEKTVRPVNLFIDKKKALELRSKLLMYRFHFVTNSTDGSEHFEGFLESPQQSMFGRIEEKALPLMTVTINEDTKNQIISFINEQVKDSLEEQKASEEAFTLSAIIEAYVNEGKDGKVAISEVAHVINRDLPEKEKISHQKIGYVSSRLGFKKTRSTSTGSRVIIYDETLVERLKTRYFSEDFTGWLPGKSSKPSVNGKAVSKPSVSLQQVFTELSIEDMEEDFEDPGESGTWTFEPVEEIVVG